MPEIQENDPAWFAFAIRDAADDMAERFSREEFMAAIADALERHNIEVCDLLTFRNAA